MALAAKPLDFVLVVVRAKPEQGGNARIEPTQAIGKLHGAQRTDFVIFAQRDLTASQRGPAVEGEDQGAVEVRKCKTRWRRGKGDARTAGTSHRHSGDGEAGESKWICEGLG